MRIGVVIPAHNEEDSIGAVIQRCRFGLEGESFRIILCDNDSTDSTARLAAVSGAEIVTATPRGYGNACMAGIVHLGDWPDVLVFLDGDGSSRPEEIPWILEPLRQDAAEFVIGVRPDGACMTAPQKWGTRLATFLVARIWGFPINDLGPFRAIRRTSLELLRMKDRTWGWTVEMQILAFLNGLETREVPVSWDQRIGGVSKISGTVTGVIRAGARILWTISWYSLRSATTAPERSKALANSGKGQGHRQLSRHHGGQEVLNPGHSGSG